MTETGGMGEAAPVNDDFTPPASPTPPTSTPATPPPSYVKLAMRNMVRKGRQSLLHFGLTAVGLAGVLLLVAWLGRPAVPGGG